MSAALGNYIHLRFKNYKENGVLRERKNKVSVPDYSKYLENRFNNVEEISQDTLDTLSERIRLNTQAEKNNRENQFERGRQQELIDLIYALLYERARQINPVLRVKEIAQGYANNHPEKGAIYTRKGVIDEKTGKLREFNYGQYGANWSTDVTHEDLKKRSDKANKIFDEIQKLITKINKGQGDATEDIKTLIQYYEDYSHLSFDLEKYIGMDARCVAKAIEDAAKAVRYEGVITAIGGHFGEMIVSLADDTCLTLAKTLVAKHIEEHVIGSHQTAALIDKGLIHNYGNKIFNTSQADGTKYHIGTTQDKVDVQITIGGKPLNVNVKSQALDEVYNPQLQEVNLLVSLAFLNQYENFGNHWLNLHVANARGMNAERNRLDENLKKEIAYLALVSGDPFKNNVPHSNTFAYINRLTGKVYVQSTRKILENLDNFGGLDRISSLRFTNKHRKLIWQRINDILHEVHKVKLYVTLQSSVIDAGS